MCNWEDISHGVGKIELSECDAAERILWSDRWKSEVYGGVVRRSWRSEGRFPFRNFLHFPPATPKHQFGEGRGLRKGKDTPRELRLLPLPAPYLPGDVVWGRPPDDAASLGEKWLKSRRNSLSLNVEDCWFWSTVVIPCGVLCVNCEVHQKEGDAQLAEGEKQG